jgi:hypothetical protein
MLASTPATGKLAGMASTSEPSRAGLEPGTGVEVGVGPGAGAGDGRGTPAGDTSCRRWIGQWLCRPGVELLPAGFKLAELRPALDRPSLSNLEQSHAASSSPAGHYLDVLRDRPGGFDFLNSSASFFAIFPTLILFGPERLELSEEVGGADGESDASADACPRQLLKIGSDRIKMTWIADLPCLTRLRHNTRGPSCSSDFLSRRKP